MIFQKYLIELKFRLIIAITSWDEEEDLNSRKEEIKNKFRKYYDELKFEKKPKFEDMIDLEVNFSSVENQNDYYDQIIKEAKWNLKPIAKLKDILEWIKELENFGKDLVNEENEKIEELAREKFCDDEKLPRNGIGSCRSFEKKLRRDLNERGFESSSLDYCVFLFRIGLRKKSEILLREIKENLKFFYEEMFDNARNMKLDSLYDSRLGFVIEHVRKNFDVYLGKKYGEVKRTVDVIFDGSFIGEFQKKDEFEGWFRTELIEYAKKTVNKNYMKKKFKEMLKKVKYQEGRDKELKFSADGEIGYLNEVLEEFKEEKREEQKEIPKEEIPMEEIQNQGDNEMKKDNQIVNTEMVNITSDINSEFNKFTPLLEKKEGSENRGHPQPSNKLGRYLIVGGITVPIGAGIGAVIGAWIGGNNASSIGAAAGAIIGCIGTHHFMK